MVTFKGARAVLIALFFGPCRTLDRRQSHGEIRLKTGLMLIPEFVHKTREEVKCKKTKIINVVVTR
jgi:hypothetical protein